MGRGKERSKMLIVPSEQAVGKDITVLTKKKRMLLCLVCCLLTAFRVTAKKSAEYRRYHIYFTK